MIALIMAGGGGLRFWPKSTPTLPKQFINLFGDKSMIRLTYERVLSLFKPENIFIVTTADQKKLIQEHIPELSNHQIILEPCGMNTAPCIATATVYLSKIYSQNESVLVLPADHYIPDTKAFAESILTGMRSIKSKSIVLFGIRPTYPATGYGYIGSGDKYNADMFLVKHFTEKPDFYQAVALLAKGNYYWNSGMFSWKLGGIMENFKRYNKEILELAIQVCEATDQNKKKKLYSKMPKLPIDIAIVEKAENVLVMPVSFAWSDVGNWFSLSEQKPKDAQGNYFAGNGYVDIAKNNAIFSDKNVAIIGVSDVILVETEGSILLVRKDMAEQVRSVGSAFPD
jgi:mannose-1-phosphate guanylyltransferase